MTFWETVAAVVVGVMLVWIVYVVAVLIDCGVRPTCAVLF